MVNDPILIHRIWRLANWLEISEEALNVIDEQCHVIAHGDHHYCVLAEDELEDALLMHHERLKGFLPNFIVQYMHLPAARQRILQTLKVRDDNPGYEAERVLLCKYECMMDDLIREGQFDKAHDLAAPDEEERPGRFFIYAVEPRRV